MSWEYVLIYIYIFILLSILFYQVHRKIVYTLNKQMGKVYHISMSIKSSQLIIFYIKHCAFIRLFVFLIIMYYEANFNVCRFRTRKFHTFVFCGYKGLVFFFFFQHLFFSLNYPWSDINIDSLQLLFVGVHLPDSFGSSLYFWPLTHWYICFSSKLLHLVLIF